jgi:hypothetical protein
MRRWRDKIATIPVFSFEDQRVQAQGEHDAHKVMTMNAQATNQADDEDMPSEIDFSKGVRGKFYKPGMRLNVPVYLDERVQGYLSAKAQAKGIGLSALVNDLLKREIELVEAMG